MSERSEYATGEFCWVDLATSDTGAAAKLYGELLGWGTQPAGPVEETGGYASSCGMENRSRATARSRRRASRRPGAAT